MSSDCKGWCDRDNQSQLILGYKNGQKYCKKCAKYFVTKAIRCYCCKNFLRCKKRYNSSSIINHKKEHTVMSERMVEIPISKETRDIIKKIKGALTYNQFFEDILKHYEEKRI